MSNKKQVGLIIAAMVSIGYFIIAGVAVPSDEKMTLSGKEIYRLNCASCHGVDRTGKPPDNPSLIGVRVKLSREEVLKQINNGKGRMPAFPHLSLAEKEALIAYLFGEEERNIGISMENMGEKIFRSNCASCHRATRNDPRPPNVWMMEPAPLAGATKRFTKQELFTILKTGICYMPSFEHFNETERESLYTYIKSLEGRGEPLRPTMGEMCPMMKRMMRRGDR